MVKFTIQTVVLRVSRRESSEIFPYGAFSFFNFGGNVYRSALISRNLPCPEKFRLHYDEKMYAVHKQTEKGPEIAFYYVFKSQRLVL